MTAAEVIQLKERGGTPQASIRDYSQRILSAVLQEFSRKKRPSADLRKAIHPHQELAITSLAQPTGT